MPWKIPEAEIEAVKRNTDFVAVVQARGIALQKHGTKDWRGLCPFHPDQQTPNFIVTPGKGLFHCMSCGAAGNVIQFVERHDGVSFRHAFELLRDGAGLRAQPRLEQATVPKLPCPLDVAADDATLCSQVAAYYAERLKAWPSAHAYLKSRGLDDEALIARFRLGFADRTLGLRLPEKNRVEGAKLRTRLAQLGVLRAKTGHEHFNGCIVVPLHDSAGQIVSFYGRRVGAGEVKHLYPEGPHRGLFNPAAFDAPEVILCEAVIDALTFCAHGFSNATCIYGTEGMTEEIFSRLKKARRVLIAYDADQAGERAAERDGVRLKSVGVDVARLRFPPGLDANAYALKVQPAAKSLAVLLQAAVVDAPSARSSVARVSSLAASVSSRTTEPAAKEEKSAAPVAPTNAPTPPQVNAAPANTAAAPALSASGASMPVLELKGSHHVLELDGREYRIGGLEKTLGTEALKIALRVKVGERFHLDTIDLAKDAERRRFVERAAEETGLTPELLRRDLGRVLLAVEQAQAELARPAETIAPVVVLTDAERAEALGWLTAPDLVARLRAAFHTAGIVGEDNNVLVAYLACVSRKLERPLAIIVQSPSAAGKTTLMDAVLAFFPEEERIKYSAMTGQSLYYLGETNLKHKILAIVEEAGAEKAAYALKLLQSEGELTIASTGKDPQTGRMETQEYHVEGPVMIMLTTTAIDLDEELQNRCLTLAVDDSPEQTARIHALQRERRTLAGLVAKTQRAELLRVLKNAQRLLAPVEVLNPYAPALTFPSQRTRNRRDHEKYLTLIDAIALLHQHQRPRGRHEVGGRFFEYVAVTLDDIALANELAPEVIGRSLDELPPQTRRVLDFIRALVRSRAAGPAPADAAASGGAASLPPRPSHHAATFTRRELHEACGWSFTQLRVHLDRLIEQEYLGVRCGRMGSQFVYELLIDADANPQAAHIALIDVAELKKKHGYNPNLAGEKGDLAGGDGAGPRGAT